MDIVELFKITTEKKASDLHIIAVEGDKVTIINGKVLVNNKPSLFPNLAQNANLETIVPENNIFQKGDNAKTIYGLLPVNAVIGKVIFSF